MKYTVYKITNLINAKIYIGVHKTDNLEDGYMGSGINIKRAIKKYGLKNFKKEYLAIFENQDDMFKMESELVNEEFIKNKNNYNINAGGYGSFDFINQNLDKIWGGDGRQKQHEHLTTIHKQIPMEKRKKIGEYLGKNFGGSNKLTNEEINKRLTQIKDIDLTKFGWVKLVSGKLKITHTQTRRFMEKYYIGEYFRRK